MIPKRFVVAWIIWGMTSMIGQIVLLRELLAVFYGNEVTLGIMLAGWLLWVGVGSLGLGRIALRIRKKTEVFLLGQVLVALLLPLSILLVRLSKVGLGFSTGEIIGLVPIVLITFVLLAPFCLVVGFLFALSCQLFVRQDRDAAQHIGRVYVYEAVGATLGGAAFSYLFIHLFHPFHMAWLVGGLNVLSALSIAVSRQYLAKRTAAGFLLLLLLAGLIAGFHGVDHIQRYSVTWQWPGFEFRSTNDSEYGNITVNERSGQINFFENGLLMFANPDRFSAEESVHFPLLEHPRPKRVLLIGGGVNGSLAEILKHPVESVTYVELDPLLVEMAEQYIAAQDLMLDDPRVVIDYLDGRLFVKRPRQDFDVVVINLPEPYTSQLNRFYTVEFYREVRSILAPGGVLSFRMPSAENYISDELARILASFHQTLKRVFADVAVLPGDSNIFLACQSQGVLTRDAQTLIERLNQRSIEAQYIQEYYLPFRLKSERAAYLDERIAGTKNVRINSDFHPISSFYDMVHWTTQFRTALPSVFRFLGSLTLWRTLIPLGLLSLAIFLLSLRWVEVRRASILIAVGVTGALEIIFEVIILLVFQVLFGFVYAKLGLILMGFMIGLGAGGLWMNKSMRRKNRSIGDMLKIQGALCVYPLLLIGIFQVLSSAKGSAGIFISSEILFPLITAAGGFLGGMQFPLANKLYIEQRGQVGHSGGKIYGIDVLGSSLGALLAGSILIPVLGIWNTCLVLACLSSLAFCLLLVLRFKAP